MIRHHVLLLACVVSACHSDPARARFEKLASDSEPHFAALRASADTVVHTHGDGEMFDRTIVRACTESMKNVEALGELDFDDRVLQPTPNHSVSDVAQNMVANKKLFCDQLKSMSECSRWCVSAYADLAVSIERFRADAARHGVGVRGLLIE